MRRLPVGCCMRKWVYIPRDEENKHIKITCKSKIHWLFQFSWYRKSVHPSELHNLNLDYHVLDRVGNTCKIYTTGQTNNRWANQQQKQQKKLAAEIPILLIPVSLHRKSKHQGKEEMFSQEAPQKELVRQSWYLASGDELHGNIWSNSCKQNSNQHLQSG